MWYLGTWQCWVNDLTRFERSFLTFHGSVMVFSINLTFFLEVLCISFTFLVSSNLPHSIPEYTNVCFLGITYFCYLGTKFPNILFSIPDDD